MEFQYASIDGEKYNRSVAKKVIDSVSGVGHFSINTFSEFPLKINLQQFRFKMNT